MRRVLSLLAAVALLGACSDQQQAETKRDPAPAETGRKTSAQIPAGKGFDFYVLSLSWSPTWCAENDASGRSEQCRRGGGYGFIVHGLWPQYDRGYPEFCPTRQPDRVPEALGRQIMDIIPSMGLIGHQWRKHGSCSGLTQRDYFAVTRAARERVTIPQSLDGPKGQNRVTPDAVEKTLIAANPGLKQTGVAVTCDRGRLEEVRICLKPDLSFRACPEVDRSGCRAKTLEQLPIR